MHDNAADTLGSFPRIDATQVYFDFDGTISTGDLLDELIVRYSADDSWKVVEEEWQAGLIGSRECLSREFALLRISQQELDEFLSQVTIDPGMTPLAQMLTKLKVPTAILSDGIDTFIHSVLDRHGLGTIPVRANRLVRHDQRWELLCPWASTECSADAAHCKCSSAKALRMPNRKIIYIGDGRSDLCPAREAAIVFAKGVLARCLAAEQIPFIPYTSLDDVMGVMRAAWAIDSPIRATKAVARQTGR